MSLFDSSYLYRIGLDTPADADDSIVAEFDEFYTRVHMPDALAENPGFTLGHRYELSVPDDRGLRAPRSVGSTTSIRPSTLTRTPSLRDHERDEREE